MTHRQIKLNHINKNILLIEYVPENGNSFISVTAPGFAGTTTAMNRKGLGIGTHVLFSSDVNFWEIGMGVLNLSRKAIQYADSVDEALVLKKG